MSAGEQMKTSVTELKSTIDVSKGGRNKKAVVAVTGKTTNSKIPITEFTVSIADGRPHNCSGKGLWLLSKGEKCDLCGRPRSMLEMPVLSDYRDQERHRIETLDCLLT